MSFFESLVKPSWIPPDWMFPAAWFTLWALQLGAAALLISSERDGRALALGLLGAHFIMAIAWQAAVFGPGRLQLAAWWLVVVLVLAVVAVAAAAQVDGRAAVMIAPTIMWVSVATVLGFSLLQLNPGA